MYQICEGHPRIMGICGSPDRIIMSNPQAMEDAMKPHPNSMVVRKESYAQDAMKYFLGDNIFITEGSSWFHQRETTSQYVYDACT